MAFTTPPTFSDGALLTASQLNILSDDLEHLYGIVQAPQVPFRKLNLNLQGSVSQYYYVRHRSKYLNLKIEYVVDNSWGTHIEWGLDVTTAAGANANADSDDGNYTSTSTATDTIAVDIDGLTNAPTDGEWYLVTVEANLHNASHVVQGTTGSSVFAILFMYESDVSIV